MVREQLPEDRQDRLVGEDHPPRRLDPVRQARAQVAGERLAQQPFPRVELEEVEDRPLVEVREAADVVPADVAHVEADRLVAGLLRGVAQVGHRHEVFDVLGVGEVDRLAQQVVQRLPLRDQLLVDGVELVRSGNDLLLPLPLHDSRLEQHRRRVGVELEELRWLARPVAEVEAPVDGRMVVVPRGLDQRHRGVGNRQLGVAALGDDVLDGVEAARPELVGRRLDPLHVGRGQAVVRGLVPVHLSVRVMEDHADGFGLGLPVGARGDRAALDGG